MRFEVSGEAYQQRSAVQKGVTKHPAEVAKAGFVPAEVVSDFETPELMRSQLVHAAERVINEGSEIQEHDGKKYWVTLGNEHFAVGDVSFVEAHTSEPDVFGYRLWRQLPGSKERKMAGAFPIYLVANGDIKKPVMIMQPGSGAVTKSGDFNSVSDMADLKKAAEIVEAIAHDTREKKVETQAKREKKHARVKKYIGATALAVTIALGAGLGYSPVIDAYDNWQADQQEQQAKTEAEAQAEAAAKQATRQKLEERVKRFDETTEMESGTTVSAGQTAAASATDQFIDVSVPSYESNAMSAELAHDIEGNIRAFEVPEIGESSTSASLSINLGDIKADDNYQINHNGSSKDVIVTYFDARTNQLEIMNLGSLDGGPASATQIYVTEITGG